MQGSDFTQDEAVQRTLSEIKQEFNQRPVSDIIDSEGHQYVDLVMEGGGVLGIALLGYTYALEETGIRFLNIGGTSAGSIGALLLAAADSKDKPKSERIAVALANQDLSLFMDGSPSTRRFLRAALNKKWFRSVFYYLRTHSTFWKKLGFNPGDAFLKWLKSTLRSFGIETTRDLMRRMAYQPEGLQDRDSRDLTGELQQVELAMITAEVLTETKVELPNMAELFWENYEEINPACYVRASMSVPYFFYPYRVKDLPQGPAARERWRRKANFETTPPKEALFIDGGIMSNFPIDVFHVNGKVPLCPTFGVKLGSKTRKAQEVEHPHDLGLAMFNAARHCLDYDFIHRHPDYKRLLSYIDTGDHDWLDFDLSDSAMVDLFRRGVRAARRFLETFKWEEYKDMRADMVRAHQKTPSLPSERTA